MTDSVDSSLASLAAQLGAALLARKLMIATAESCTGGLVAAALTSIAGSSDWFDRGFVTYSNLAKHDMLGVPLALIEQHGAVSEEVARAMAEGALKQSVAQVAISITGIAGPSGGSAAKPVGTVWHGFALQGQGHAPQVLAVHQLYSGTRAQVRTSATRFALEQALAVLMLSEGLQ
jgi:nicotinamide-nucleotide amidase